MTARWYPVRCHQDSAFLSSRGGRQFFTNEFHTLRGGVAFACDFVVGAVVGAGIIVEKGETVIQQNDA